MRGRGERERRRRYKKRRWRGYGGGARGMRNVVRKGEARRGGEKEKRRGVMVSGMGEERGGGREGGGRKG